MHACTSGSLHEQSRVVVTTVVSKSFCECMHTENVHRVHVHVVIDKQSLVLVSVSSSTETTCIVIVLDSKVTISAGGNMATRNDSTKSDHLQDRDEVFACLTRGTYSDCKYHRILPLRPPLRNHSFFRTVGGLTCGIQQIHVETEDLRWQQF